jgi:hypothetical protein
MTSTLTTIQPSLIRQESSDLESSPPLKPAIRRPLFSAHGLFLDPLDPRNHAILSLERDRVNFNRALLSLLVGCSWIAIGALLLAQEQDHWVWKLAIAAGVVIIAVFWIKYLRYRGKEFDPEVIIPGLNQISNQDGTFARIH